MGLQEQDLAEMYLDEDNRAVAFEAAMNIGLTKELRQAKQQRERKEAEAKSKYSVHAAKIYLPPVHRAVPRQASYRGADRGQAAAHPFN